MAKLAIVFPKLTTGKVLKVVEITGTGSKAKSKSISVVGVSGKFPAVALCSADKANQTLSKLSKELSAHYGFDIDERGVQRLIMQRECAVTDIKQIIK